MKFAVAAVLMALALGANSSIVPLQAVLTSQVSAISGINGLQIVGNPLAAAVAIQTVPQQALITSGPVPSAVVVAAPAPVVVAAAQGTYVAQTRGATHVAPLPGHLNSASSVNLQPAPGTV